MRAEAGTAAQGLVTPQQALPLLQAPCDLEKVDCRNDCMIAVAFTCAPAAADPAPGAGPASSPRPRPAPWLFPRAPSVGPPRLSDLPRLPRYQGQCPKWRHSSLISHSTTSTWRGREHGTRHTDVPGAGRHCRGWPRSSPHSQGPCHPLPRHICRGRRVTRSFRLTFLQGAQSPAEGAGSCPRSGGRFPPSVWTCSSGSSTSAGTSSVPRCDFYTLGSASPGAAGPSLCCWAGGPSSLHLSFSIREMGPSSRSLVGLAW